MEAHDAAEMVLNCLEIVSFHKLNDVMVMNKRNFSRIGIDRGSIPFRRIHPSTYGSVKGAASVQSSSSRQCLSVEPCDRLMHARWIVGRRSLRRSFDTTATPPAFKNASIVYIS